ncbi:IS3 family transposase [Streptosporangium sp. CA-135522]|uniref:IS3 family transposase n=1 Tax=Streptosporangium sp. CA-135522 TaxID=3240072 RepID=UPI003D941C34
MRFIHEHPGLAAVELILRVLGIPVSTYYDWRTRATRPSTRAMSDALLLEELKKIRAGHEFADTYGSPRIHKVELVYRNTWATREEVGTALFRYIDGWDNPRRIQKGLGGLSPDEYEAAWYAQQHDLPKTVSSHTELTETRQETLRETRGTSTKL